MPDGSVKHVHVVAHAVSDESGSIEFVGAVMDVTAQHQANAALERAFDEITEVTSIASGLSSTRSPGWSGAVCLTARSISSINRG